MDAMAMIQVSHLLLFDLLCNCHMPDSFYIVLRRVWSCGFMESCESLTNLMAIGDGVQSSRNPDQRCGMNDAASNYLSESQLQETEVSARQESDPAITTVS